MGVVSPIKDASAAFMSGRIYLKKNRVIKILSCNATVLEGITAFVRNILSIDNFRLGDTSPAD